MCEGVLTESERLQEVEQLAQARGMRCDPPPAYPSLTHPLLSVFAMPPDQSVHRLENVVGWYHSHPGYGCWLSGIDCSTQMTNQQYQEPFLAIVVDPVRTMASGKVEIGAFRTYPEGYRCVKVCRVWNCVRRWVMWGMPTQSGQWRWARLRSGPSAHT